MDRQLHFNLFINSRGHHEASWRHPDASALPLTDIHYYQGLAQKAEAGLFDSIFLADQLAARDDVERAPRVWLEPITALGALAMSTSRVGLIATASTTYTEPYNLARQFASLDFISNGRVGWNIVTSWSVPAARNYGDDSQVSHAERYARAEEFMQVAKGLWDSWADDTILDDRESGRYARADRIRCMRSLKRPDASESFRRRHQPRKLLLTPHLFNRTISQTNENKSEFHLHDPLDIKAVMAVVLVAAHTSCSGYKC